VRIAIINGLPWVGETLASQLRAQCGGPVAPLATAEWVYGQKRGFKFRCDALNGVERSLRSDVCLGRWLHPRLR